MGEYLKRCESVAMQCRTVEDDMQLVLSKKRKAYSELQNEYCGDVEENLLSPASSRTSGCSKHDESNDVIKKSLRSPDLVSEEFDTENSTSTGPVFSRDGDSEQVWVQLSQSTSKKQSSSPPTVLRRKISYTVPENMPSAAELEEFFAAAEEYEQKRFAEKYNYDIVKDVPLEGKYQWVRLLP